MNSYAIFVVVHLMIFRVHLVYGNIENSLKYWETLSVSKIQRRIIKRNAGSHRPLEQMVKFDSYGRHFSLILRKDNSIIAPDFKVLVMDADGMETEFNPDINLYRGSVEGEPNSFVSAYLSDDNILSAAFKTSSDFYMVEPALNLLPNASHDSMIIYRNSDLKQDNNSVCGYNDAEMKTNETFEHDQNFGRHNFKKETEQKAEGRSKRANCVGTDKNTCSLYLVIDPRFFEKVGNKNIMTSISTVISNIDTVDHIYRTQTFTGCDNNFGFEIKRIRIFPQTTTGYSYTNIQKFVTTELLSQFSEDPVLPNYCLGHLFTYQTLQSASGYVLGLGYIGNPIENKDGGICSHDGSANYNTAFTTFYSFTRSPAMMSLIVTAHEMGHNWGSPHDLETKECSPAASDGGKYIMYTSSVSGSDPNNWLFSPCSRRTIGATLTQKAVCLQAKQGTYCGNYRVEAGEQCDPGLSSFDSDPCCDTNCKFKGSARCSNINSPCCQDCQFTTKDANVVCFSSIPDVCKKDSICNGNTASCPDADPKPDGTECFNKGSCRAGECKSLCNVSGLRDCLCDKDNACKHCCADKKGTCAPYAKDGMSFVNISDGLPCSFGICNKNGKCIENLSGFIYRLWQILDLSSPGAFVKFMRNNIVITVIILSLLLWIPCSCCVCYLDRVHKRERIAMIHHLVDEKLDRDHGGKKADHDDHLKHGHADKTDKKHAPRTWKLWRSKTEKEKVKQIVEHVEEPPEDDDEDEDDEDDEDEDDEDEDDEDEDDEDDEDDDEPAPAPPTKHSPVTKPGAISVKLSPKK